jgi:hypothetical protein
MYKKPSNAIQRGMNNFFATRWHKMGWTALSLLYKPTTKPQNHEQPNLKPNGNTLSGYVGHDEFFLQLSFDWDTDVCFKVY